MSFKNTDQTYGSVAKTFHWLIALLIIGLLAVGLIMTDLDPTPAKFQIYGLHKSLGITVLILVILRLGWKSFNLAPLLPASMKRWEKLASHAGHWALYALMFAMPLTGWAMSSASGFPVSVFGLFTLPDLVAPDPALKHQFQDLHEFFSNILIGLIVLHILAALVHHYYYKDNVLRRIMPGYKGEV